MATRRQLAEQHLKRGDKLAWHEGNYDAAILEYRKALEVTPTLKEAYWRMGQTLFHSNPPRSPAAINAFQEVVRLAPVWNVGHHWLALAYEQDGQRHQAIQAFQEAIRLAPLDPRPHIALGVCLKAMKRYKEAIKSFQSGIALHPQIAEEDTRLFLADALVENGQVEEAIAEWRTILTMGGGYPSYDLPAKEAAAMLAKYDTQR